MNEKLIFCQKKINNEIIKLLLEAKQYIIWFSMLTQFSDNELNKALSICKKKKIKLYIYHGINPFLYEISKNIYIENIDMHPNFFPLYVNHMRYLSNEKSTLFGGIDYNKILENNYEQCALRVNNIPQIYDLNNMIISRKSEIKNIVHRFSYIFPLIGNTFKCDSAFIFLKNQLLSAKQCIIIESQYIQHKGLINIIIYSCLKHNIKLTIIYNDNFAINPYHPGKHNILLSWISEKYLKNETNKMLDLIRKSGIRYEFLSYRNSYTHNKIYIIDNSLMIGTCNFHTRSLTKKKDVEIGYVSKSKILVNNYKNYIKKRKKSGHFKSEKG